MGSSDTLGGGGIPPSLTQKSGRAPFSDLQSDTPITPSATKSVKRYGIQK